MSSQREDVLPVEEGGRGGVEAEWKNKKEVENAAGGGGWLSHDKQLQQQTGDNLLCELINYRQKYKNWLDKNVDGINKRSVINCQMKIRC